MRRPQHGYEPASARPDQERFLLRAVVARRVGQDDVADAEAPQPVQICGAVERVVESLVLGEVVLPKPAAGDGDSRAWQVNGGPVLERVDDLDAVRGREMLMQEDDRRLPVGHVRRRFCSPLREALRVGSEVP